MVIQKEFQFIDIQGFDFINGFKCSDVYIFDKLNTLSINIIELGFYPDQNEWKHQLIPIELSKNESDRAIDLVKYKNHYVLIYKLHVLLGNHKCKFVCGGFLEFKYKSKCIN